MGEIFFMVMMETLTVAMGVFFGNAILLMALRVAKVAAKDDEKSTKRR